MLSSDVPKPTMDFPLFFSCTLIDVFLEHWDFDLMVLGTFSQFLLTFLVSSSPSLYSAQNHTLKYCTIFLTPFEVSLRAASQGWKWSCSFKDLILYQWIGIDPLHVTCVRASKASPFINLWTYVSLTRSLSPSRSLSFKAMHLRKQHYHIPSLSWYNIFFRLPT